MTAHQLSTPEQIDLAAQLARSTPRVGAWVQVAGYRYQVTQVSTLAGDGRLYHLAPTPGAAAAGRAPITATLPGPLQDDRIVTVHQLDPEAVPALHDLDAAMLADCPLCSSLSGAESIGTWIEHQAQRALRDDPATAGAEQFCQVCREWLDQCTCPPFCQVCREWLDECTCLPTDDGPRPTVAELVREYARPGGGILIGGPGRPQLTDELAAALDQADEELAAQLELADGLHNIGAATPFDCPGCPDTYGPEWIEHLKATDAAHPYNLIQSVRLTSNEPAPRRRVSPAAAAALILAGWRAGLALRAAGAALSTLASALRATRADQ